MKTAHTPHVSPGTRTVMSPVEAVARCDLLACDALATAGGKATGPGQALWEAARAAGRLNLAGRPLTVLATSGPAAAVAGMVGLALTGARVTATLPAAALAEATTELAEAAAKHVPLVLHVTAGVGALPAVPGWFQLCAADAQEAVDLALVARRVAERALVPAMVVQPAASGAESLLLPGPDLVRAWLGLPEELLDAPTPAQRMLYGPRRRRVPEAWSVDQPALTGAAFRGAAAAHHAAAQGPYFLDHVGGLIEAALGDFQVLSGRTVGQAVAIQGDGADYLIVTAGPMAATASAVADHLRRTRRLRVGVVALAVRRPFPAGAVVELLRRRKGVAVLEPLSPGMGDAPPLAGEVRAALQRALENGAAGGDAPPHPGLPALKRAEHAPPVYSAAWGGDPEGLEGAAVIAAVENMVAGGPRLVWVGTDFLPPATDTPKQEIAAQTLGDAYPEVASLGRRGSEAPDLLPPKSLVVRVQGISGRTLFGAPEHPAAVLAGLTGQFVKTFPAADVPRGRPAPETIVVAQERVRTVAVPRAAHVLLVAEAAALPGPAGPAGLVPGAAVVLNSPHTAAETLWNELPAEWQQAVADGRVRLYRLDASGIAAEEARIPAERQRAQGQALLGALLHLPEVAALTGVQERALAREVRQVVQARLAAEGEEDTESAAWISATVRRGTEALQAVPPLGVTAEPAPDPGSRLPEALKRRPETAHPLFDPHRFWERMGFRGRPSLEAPPLADPFTAAGTLPAATAMLHDGAAAQAVYPQWLPAPCTGCGACWVVCPDSALPGLVTGLGDLLQTAVREVEAGGAPVRHLPRAVRQLEGFLRQRLAAAGVAADVRAVWDEAVAETVTAAKLPPEAAGELTAELAHLTEAAGDFPLAVTEPFFTAPEAARRGDGGLLSVTLDPSKCKACGACVAACPEGALELRPRTPELLAAQRRVWSFWQALPTTPERYIQREPAAEGPGPATLLLDKTAHHSLTGGDAAPPGSPHKTLVRLFAAAATAAIQPRVAAHLAHLDDLIERLERHIRLKLAVDVGDTEAVQRAVEALRGQETTLAALSERLDREHAPLDTAWLERVTGLMAGLKRLRAAYRPSDGGAGVRSALGMAAAGLGDGAWDAAYPFNPYPFPWSRHGLLHAPALAAGLFEGHMARMAEGFRCVRQTELELEERYNPQEHDAFFAGFNWRHFSAEEFLLCPPVLVTGGDATLGGAALGELMAALRSGRPLKVLVLDGQALAPLRAAVPPPPLHPVEAPAAEAAEALPRRADLALLGLMLERVYVLQGSLADAPGLLAGFVEGLATQRPALFNVFAADLPADGSGDALAVEQARLALRTRVHPVLRWHPERGLAPHERLSLAGNPDPDAPWPTHTLTWRDEGGAEQASDGPSTPADFAVTVPDLQHHFRPVPEEGADDALTPLAEVLEMAPEERGEAVPYIEAVDYRGRLQRLVVSAALVAACDERQAAWRVLRAITRADQVPVDEQAIARAAKDEVTETVWRNLVEMARGATAPAASSDPSGANGAEAAAS